MFTLDLGASYRRGHVDLHTRVQVVDKERKVLLYTYRWLLLWIFIGIVKLSH